MIIASRTALQPTRPGASTRSGLTFGLIGLLMAALGGCSDSGKTEQPAPRTESTGAPAASPEPSTAPSAPPGKLEPEIPVPSDPKARYFLIKREGTSKKPILTTRRVGPSGNSFSKRVFDCRKHTFKYLGDGNTLAEMEKSKPEPTMAELVDGSISDYVWRYACGK